MHEKRIQILIKEETEKGPFRDAIYYTESEFALLDDKAIETAVKARVDNYVAFRTVQDAKEPEVPSEEALLEYKAELEEKLQEVNNKLGGE